MQKNIGSQSQLTPRGKGVMVFGGVWAMARQRQARGGETTAQAEEDSFGSQWIFTKSNK
jgi:hypothetical protein